MSDDEDIAALVVDNGSGMCKGECVHGVVYTEEIKFNLQSGNSPTLADLLVDGTESPYLAKSLFLVIYGSNLHSSSVLAPDYSRFRWR